MSASQGSWWNWVQNAKEKVVSQSSEVFEFVKNDIQEFSKVVSEEASSVVNNTTSVLKDKLKLEDESSSANQVKKSISGFFSHVSEVFTPSPEDGDEEAIMMWNQEPVSLDRLQAAKFAFCSTPSNFLREPLEGEDCYEQWLQDFEPEAHEGELATLLEENELLQKTYSSLVPSEMTHNQFCLRYFFEMDKLEKAEEKRQQIKKRASVIAASEEPEIVWGDEDEASDAVEISEEMQQQLLEEYEKEMKQNATKSSDSPCLSDPPSSSSSKIDVDWRSKSSSPSKDTEDEWEKVESEEGNFEEVVKNGD